jgi:hypothetical protein
MIMINLESSVWICVKRELYWKDTEVTFSWQLLVQTHNTKFNENAVSNMQL